MTDYAEQCAKYKWIVYKLCQNDDNLIWSDLHKNDALKDHLDKIKTIQIEKPHKLSWAFLTQGHNYDPGIQKLINSKFHQKSHYSSLNPKTTTFSKLSKKSSKNINPYCYSGGTKPIINASTMSPMPWKKVLGTTSTTNQKSNKKKLKSAVSLPNLLYYSNDKPMQRNEDGKYFINNNVSNISSTMKTDTDIDIDIDINFNANSNENTEDTKYIKNIPLESRIFAENNKKWIGSSICYSFSQIPRFPSDTNISHKNKNINKNKNKNNKNINRNKSSEARNIPSTSRSMSLSQIRKNIFAKEYQSNEI